jgi:hypothetical protein
VTEENRFAAINRDVSQNSRKAWEPPPPTPRDGDYARVNKGRTRVLCGFRYRLDEAECTGVVGVVIYGSQRRWGDFAMGVELPAEWIFRAGAYRLPAYPAKRLAKGERHLGRHFTPEDRSLGALTAAVDKPRRTHGFVRLELPTWVYCPKCDQPRYLAPTALGFSPDFGRRPVHG